MNLGDSERQITESVADASRSYVGNPTARHQRAMNTLYEALKQKGALVNVASSAVGTMNLGGRSGMVALAKTTVADGPKAD